MRVFHLLFGEKTHRMLPKAAKCLIVSYFATLAKNILQVFAFSDKVEIFVRPKMEAILLAILDDLTDPSSTTNFRFGSEGHVT